MFMKLSTDGSLGKRINSIEIDFNPNIISPSPHTNVTPEWESRHVTR